MGMSSQFVSFMIAVNPELKAREGEDLEEEKFSYKDSIIFIDTQTSTSDPNSKQNTKSGRGI